MSPDRLNTGRVTLLCVVFPSLLLFLFTRLAYVQFFHPHDLIKYAENQTKLVVKIPPYRGKIYDRNGAALALDVQLDSVGAHSKDVKDPAALAKKLHEILGGDERVLRERLSRRKDFVWLARKITPAQSIKIARLKRREIEIRKEWKRIYPNRETASHVLGFVGLDHEGLEGLESFYDSYLKGVPGWKLTEKDAKQRELVSMQTDLVLPVDGYNLRLTIDRMIQHQADIFLSETCKKYKALGGAVVVMDPRTGDILALSNYPVYDPNNLKSVSLNVVRNRAVTDIYEPGSVFKVITLSAVLEEKAAKLTDTFFCENGEYRIGGRTLHDVHPYGRLTLEEVIAKSSNIGTVKAASKVGAQKLHDTIKKFGFGERTGLPFASESPGLLTNPKNYSATSMSSVPIGQEVGLTAIQLAAAVSAIANDGVLMKPRLVTRVEDNDAVAVREFPVETKRRAISRETARQVRQAMQKVVKDGGTGKLAAIPGAEVGGKTGTSQKLDAEGRYSHSNFISSFIGYVEKNGRLFTITVSIDDPHPVYYGGVVAAPLFSKVGKAILDYYQIGDVPEPKKAPAKPAAMRGKRP